MSVLKASLHVIPLRQGAISYNDRWVTNLSKRLQRGLLWIKARFWFKNKAITIPRTRERERKEPTLDELALRVQMAYPNTRKIAAAQYVAAIIRGER